MKKSHFAWVGIIWMGSWMPLTVMGYPLTILNGIEETAQLEVNESDTFLTILETIKNYYQESSHSMRTAEEFSFNRICCDFEISTAGITVRSKQTPWREYEVSVSKQEKKELSYIITTLANDSLISIGTSRSSLKKAGEKIDHLHPLRFLMTIFVDERLKAGAHAIRDRGGLAWNGFLDGITGSLKEEAGRENLLQYVDDFAGKVKIDSALIQPSLEKGKWTEFVNLLIDKIPREIDPNRYDM